MADTSGRSTAVRSGRRFGGRISRMILSLPTMRGLLGHRSREQEYWTPCPTRSPASCRTATT
ncbi:hypothetical protein GS506_16385 [Rhodococcus hoagii]|nr:hypothetical protein [Prescottella equi]